MLIFTFLSFLQLLLNISGYSSFGLTFKPYKCQQSSYGNNRCQSDFSLFSSSVSTSATEKDSNEITAKSITNEIMGFFASSNVIDQKKITNFRKRLDESEVQSKLDGMHMITILFQSSRSRRLAKAIYPLDIILKKLKSWDRQWSERDISTFVYGIRSMECITPLEGEILKLGALKISESQAELSSRAIGNALYGLQGISSDTQGAAELCAALADKIKKFSGDLNGQDIGIGLYGLQGMSSDVPEIRKLINVLAEKVASTETELDAQAIGNALYGLQSFRSEEVEVRRLVAALAVKVGDSRPELTAQSIGSGLYGLQRLGSESLEVRTLVSALAEKLESTSINLDPQAIGNALFGLQRMKSNVPEVRALLQAVTNKLQQLDSSVQMDTKGIGSALYGLHSMSSEVPQVRTLLAALANRISLSADCFLNGQGIADSLYGLSGMSYDCPELRSLLNALAGRIDANVGKLDSQEIGNALFGLQSLTSDMQEARLIVSKLADKVRRSKALLRSQHIGRALLGLQKFSAEYPEVRYLLKQLTKRIAESDRTRMTASAIADSVHGLQSMTSDVPEVQELVGELAKKIATTAAELTPVQIGHALFGLQSLSSAGSIFEESAIGIDADEVQFMLSALWDKVKVVNEPMPLASVALGLQGLTHLRDPIANNLRQYLYTQAIRLGSLAANGTSPIHIPSSETEDSRSDTSMSFAQVRQIGLDRMDIVSAVRAMRLNDLKIPRWLAAEYIPIEESKVLVPTALPQSRSDKIILQRFQALYPTLKWSSNSLVDGFRLDMNFPTLKMNIELDGPSHRQPARARFDSDRDAYLSLKKGYEVYRIKIQGKSTDEIVSLIYTTVMQRTEKLADLEIQKLYAKKA